MDTTKVFSMNIEAYLKKVRFIVNQGGTSSGKTYAILQLLRLIAEAESKSQKGLLISVVSESLPHLKKGAMRDFHNILLADGSYDERRHNKSTRTYLFGNSAIEFFSADNGSKVRGLRRDILFLNECNNVTKEAFDQLSIRTKRTIFLDYNPVGDFYVSEEILNKPEVSFELIKSNYTHNHLLDESIVKEIERRRLTDPNWWRVYGEGEFGVSEGVIFPIFNIVDEMPDTPKRKLGLDFGFSNDPTALIDVRYSDGELWLDELLYRTQMTNYDIAQFIKSEPDCLRVDTVADSAEPKSIAELQLAGLHVTGADKSGDSIRNGIDMMLQVKINVTRRSVNLIKELRNYRWKVDRNGKSQNVPIDIWNHGIDAARYAATQLLGQRYSRRVGRINVPR
jgi:phage terminase large subunit